MKVLFYMQKLLQNIVISFIYDLDFCSNSAERGYKYTVYNYLYLLLSSD